MSMIDSGLGWSADSEYVCMTAGALLAAMGGRDYNKTNGTASLVFLDMYTGTYRHPALLSTDADAVKYYCGGTTFSYNQTFNIDGITWYYCRGGYGFWDGTYTTANYPTFDEFDLYSASLTETQIRRLLTVAGVTFANPYTVSFEPNGGSGSMPDQSIPDGEPTALDTCTFTRSGFMFIGWATSAGGPVAYTDGQIVTDIAPAGGSVTLYAVWEPEALRCIIQNNKSEANRAVKELTDIRSSNFVLKDPTSIIDPVLIIACDITDIIEANYITVPVFRRSYFIIDMISVRKGLTEIHAHVDVLSSYIEQLKTCEAVIHRQENSWNLYLDDGIFKTYQNPRIGVKAFPSGFTTQNFVLAVAGD